MYTTCQRCGTPIKHVFVYEDKNYGSECVQIVSGIKIWELPEDETNIDEYLKNKEQLLKQLDQKEKEIQQRKEYYYNKNKWLIDYLIEKDKKQIWSEKVGDWITIQEQGFCYNIANDLLFRDIEQLSDKVFDIIIDMWAVDNGGRRGSKKYDKAYDQFLELAGIE
jgi:hypothetical protein